MKRTLRTPLAAATALATVAALAACSGGSAAPDPSTPVDMTMTVWTSDEKIIATLESLADDFRKDNPSLGSFEVQSIPFAEYTKQLSVQLTGGKAPDLAWIVEANMPAFIASGALHDISAVKTDAAFGFDQYLPNVLSQVSTDAGLFGIPFANTAQPVIYNVGAFEAAGVDTPAELAARGEWTWENLRRIAKEMKDSGQVTYGFDIPQFALQNYQFMNVFLKGWGAQAFPDGTSCGLADSASVDAFSYLHDLIFTDDTYPGPGETSSFSSGDTAMMIGAPSTLNTITDTNIRTAMAPQPDNIDGGTDYFLGQAYVTTLADGQAPDLAARLLAHLTSEDAARQLAGYYVSGREPLLQPELVSQASPRITAEDAETALIEPLKTATQVSYPVAYPEIAAGMRADLDSIWQPTADIAQQLEKACAVAEPLLAK